MDAGGTLSVLKDGASLPLSPELIGRLAGPIWTFESGNGSPERGAHTLILRFLKFDSYCEQCGLKVSVRN
jgi:hypothetical protein